MKAVISAGSNVEPEHNLPEAVNRLRHHAALRVLAVSPTYRSPAVGAAGKPDFLNAALLVDTDLQPVELKRQLRNVEAALGRVRSGDRNAPRTIDLDTILYEGFVGDVDGTHIPDPDLARHPHLVVPAADVAPDWEYGDDSAPLHQLAGPFRDRITMTSNLNHEPQDRYASERSMEAVADEVYDPVLEENVRQMLVQLGEDPEREGLSRTPLRVAKAMDFLTSGYTMSLDEIVNNAVFENDADEMVLVKDVEFYSLCEHHMLPFFGKAHVAYMPNRRIIGLSKIARIVDLFSRRLQVQERLTNQIADAIEQVLAPHGVAVVMEASHFCMMMRGVQKQGSSMITSAMRGGFRTNASSRAEFLNLIGD